MNVGIASADLVCSQTTAYASVSYLTWYVQCFPKETKVMQVSASRKYFTWKKNWEDNKLVNGEVLDST